MKKGYLSEYFKGIAAKRLSAVEASMLVSNQHEFNGVEGLRQILGEPSGKCRYQAKVVYLSDDIDEAIIDDATFTWYDARQKAREERGVMRYEYRLYFPTTNVSLNAKEGDLLLIAKHQKNGLLVIVAAQGSSISRQIEWLFGLKNLTQPGYAIKVDLDTESDRIEYTSRIILESIGIEVEESEPNFLDEMLYKFGKTFPTTKEFSTYARSTLKDIIVTTDSADEVLIAWMEREEKLFRTLERYLISNRLSIGFGNEKYTDVDGFISYSLSIQNRRKSRVGYALENHLETIFRGHGVSYSRTAVTENKSKPDFLFPGVEEYKDANFKSEKLTMLGVKSTCKDRWRQVLAEAERIEKKHLLTLEPAISCSQTDEMQAKKLQLVIPSSLHCTYTTEQASWLMSITEFINIVKEKQFSEPCRPHMLKPRAE